MAQALQHTYSTSPVQSQNVKEAINYALVQTGCFLGAPQKDSHSSMVWDHARCELESEGQSSTPMCQYISHDDEPKYAHAILGTAILHGLHETYHPHNVYPTTYMSAAKNSCPSAVKLYTWNSSEDRTNERIAVVHLTADSERMWS